MRHATEAETLHTNPIRRMKTYTGGQGYVYQYYFVGSRPSTSENKPAVEYIFDVTSDRKTTFSVSILMLDEGVKTWAATHGRSLSDAEQYGTVKMRLFEAFDQVEDMMAHGRNLQIDRQDLDRLLGTLGVQ
jgi:hypothetical protein